MEENNDNKTITINFKADEPTVNGRIYPKELLLKAFAEKEEFYVEHADPKHIKEVVTMRNVIGSTKLEIKDDNTISGSFRKFETNAWKAIKDIPFEELSFTTNGLGKTDENNIINDFKLISIVVFPKDKIDK